MESGKRLRRAQRPGGFTLIELLIVIIIIGILAAIAIPMFLNQRDKAKNAGVREGVHAVQVGVHTYMIDNTDQVPAVTQVDGVKNQTPSHLGDFIDNWPKNPWTGAMMFRSAARGDYTYTPTGSCTYQLAGHLSSGDFVVP